MRFHFCVEYTKLKLRKKTVLLNFYCNHHTVGIAINKHVDKLEPPVSVCCLLPSPRLPLSASPPSSCNKGYIDNFSKRVPVFPHSPASDMFFLAPHTSTFVIHSAHFNKLETLETGIAVMFWFAFETRVPTIIFQNTRELFDSRAEENPKITCSLETHALAIKSRLFVNERLCWFICCRVRGYNRSARACALVCVRSVSIVCLCVRLGKGQRDTVLHITALQMAVVSGCDSESE